MISFHALPTMPKTKRVPGLRAIPLVCLLTLLVSFGAGAATTSTASAELSAMLPANIKASGKIVVGALMDVPPVDFYDKNGKPAGVNSGLAHAIGELLGVKFHFRQYKFAGLRPALQAGQIDLIWDSMNDTVARQKVLDFIDYLGSPDTLLLPAGNPKHVKSLADMCGMAVATVRGAVQILRVKAASKKCTANGDKPITLKLYGSASDGRLQVHTGRAEAFIGNGPVLFYLAKTANDGKTFDAVRLKEDKAAYYGIAFRKKDTQLRKAISAALAAVMESGEYRKVLEKYGLEKLGLSKPLLNSAGK